MTEMLRAVALVGDPGERFRLLLCADGVIAVVPRGGLNPEVVTAWTRRFGLNLHHAVPLDTRPAPPLARLATVVLAPDRRVSVLASEYAHAVGAAVFPVADVDAVRAAIADARDAKSATLVVLNDAFDETLVDAIRRGNAERVRRGTLPLTWGVLTAFDVPKLAWLATKTLAWLVPRAVPGAAIGRFDGVRGTATLRTLGGTVPPSDVLEPWTDPCTLAQSAVAHGVSFDLSLGDIVLCGHLDPPLPAARTEHAPTCFHNGGCFRLGRGRPPSTVRRAWEATPLFWGIDSCGVIPFRRNAFGDGTSYALGLLAGSAIAIIGSYLPLMASGLAARAFEALLESGWSTGEIAAALGCIDDNADGFNPYLILGSPDVRLVEVSTDGIAPDNATFRIKIDGRDTIALELPASRPGLRDVVADDGHETWSGALARRVDAPERAALIVAFDRPRRHAGNLQLGDVGTQRTALAAGCDELGRRIGVLIGYRFAAPYAEHGEALRASFREIAAILRSAYALRAPAVGAVRWAYASEDLRVLEESVSRQFVDVVVEHDFSFDRESENGFVPAPLLRSTERCHVCGGVLYVATDRWSVDETYQRIKATCPNCFGVAMRLATSSLASVSLASAADGGRFAVELTIRSAANRPLRALVAAAPRRGPAEHATGPHAVDVPPRGEARFDLCFPLSTSGVVTYRILVLCEGAAEFYTALDSGRPSSASTSSKVETVVGPAPAPGQARPDGLNQTG